MEGWHVSGVETQKLWGLHMRYSKDLVGKKSRMRLFQVGKKFPLKSPVTRGWKSWFSTNLEGLEWRKYSWEILWRTLGWLLCCLFYWLWFWIPPSWVEPRCWLEGWRQWVSRFPVKLLITTQLEGRGSESLNSLYTFYLQFIWRVEVDISQYFLEKLKFVVHPLRKNNSFSKIWLKSDNCKRDQTRAIYCWVEGPSPKLNFPNNYKIIVSYICSLIMNMWYIF